MFDGPLINPDHITRAKLPANDIGNANRLNHLAADDLIFVNDTGWAAWTGAKYDLANGRLAAETLAQRLPELVAEELQALNQAYDNWSKQIDSAEPGQRYDRDAFVSKIDVLNHEKLMRSCGNTRRYKAALDALRTQITVSRTQLDTVPHLLSCANGTLDLDAFTASKAFPRQRKRTGEALDDWASVFFGPHQKAHKPTKAAPVTYSPAAKCPTFTKTISLIFPDKEIRTCFQRCAGAMLYGQNRSQAFLILRGGGGNGKSTLMNALTSVLGDYAGSCQPEMFLRGSPQNAGGPTPADLALTATRMVAAAEPEKFDALSGAKIKAFTGGDTQAGRGMYAKSMTEYTATALPVLSCNRTPRILDDDEGLRRRLVFIPFTQALHRLPADQRVDPQRIADLLDKERSGILNWMLDGYRDYAARLNRGQGLPPGIDPPQQLQALRDNLLAQADSVGAFLTAETHSAPGTTTRYSELFARYESWANLNGAAELNSHKFRNALVEKNFRFKPSGGYSKVIDVALREEAAR